MKIPRSIIMDAKTRTNRKRIMYLLRSRHLDHKRKRMISMIVFMNEYFIFLKLKKINKIFCKRRTKEKKMTNSFRIIQDNNTASSPIYISASSGYSYGFVTGYYSPNNLISGGLYNGIASGNVIFQRNTIGGYKKIGDGKTW